MFIESTLSIPTMLLTTGEAPNRLSSVQSELKRYGMTWWSNASNGGMLSHSAAIQVLEQGVEIAPQNMLHGRPYTFELEGRHFVAVRRGEDEVDLYVVPD